MTEQKLKDYFEGKINAGELSLDLKDSQKRTSYDVTTVYINKSLSDGEFAIQRKHLIKLCDDVISQRLLPSDLKTIAYALIASDFFIYDINIEDEKIINDVISDWDSPEIGFDLSMKNILLWKEYLLTGIYGLDENELKLKFRSKGKHLKLYQSIDEILWIDWDPIGINNEGPRDEYQSYTSTILRLKIGEADRDEIAQKLYEMETGSMGLSGNLDHCRLVAEKILNL